MLAWTGDRSPIRGCTTSEGVQVSDTLNPHKCLFPGTRERHPGSASGRSGCLAVSLSSFPGSFTVVSAIPAQRDRHAVPAGHADGLGVRVVDESCAHGPQLVDQVCGLARRGDLSGAVVFWRAVARQEDGQGGQVGQDLVLADMGVLRPAWVRVSGAGVAVAAPVGRLAVGPGGFQPPSSPAAGQQSGQQVLPRGRPGRAARSSGVLRCDEVGLADQRGVCRMLGDDPAFG